MDDRMLRKTIMAAVIFLGIMAAALVCCLIFKPSPFVYLMARLGYFYDEYHDGSPNFRKFAEDLRNSFEAGGKKDSVIIIYYQPAFHSDCIIRLTPDSVFITRVNCRLDVTSSSKYEGIILNKDIGKYAHGQLFREPSIYRQMLNSMSPSIKSIRHRGGSTVPAEGALVSVVFHLGDIFNAFELYVSHYHDDRYNMVQQAAALILDKSGTVTAEELKGYGFIWQGQ